MKKLFFLLAAFLLTFSAQASGIVHLKTGATLEMTAESLLNAQSYTWVLKNGEQVLNKQETRDFRYTFAEKGAYTANITAKMNDGSLKSTTVQILVADTVTTGDGAIKEFAAVLESLPQANIERTVSLTGESAAVQFIASASRGEITEYRLDLDLATDSDGDGNPKNDADNKDHNSFFNGSPFEKTFYKKDAPQEIGLTVIGRDGRSDTAILKIVFTDSAATFEARLSTFPPADKDGVIHLTGDKAEITFYAGGSPGGVKEYRIDKNINFDSDNNGKKDDDIDNLSDASFSTGEMWTTDYEKVWGETVAQLTVVTADKKGSRIQRKIVFDSAVPVVTPGEPLVNLIADKTTIAAGESVSFALFPVPKDAIFKWDFDGDGVVDAENNSATMGFLYEIGGEFTATLTVEQNGDIKTYTKTITVSVSETPDGAFLPPTADFSYLLDQNIATFGNLSKGEATPFTYLWDFGDGETSTEESPVHTYKKHGSFLVILATTNSQEQVAKKNQIIDVPLIPGLTDEAGGMNQEAGGQDVLPPAGEEVAPEKPFKFGVGVIVAIIILSLLLIPVFILLAEKIRHPDLTFEEIIEGWKEKFFGGAGHSTVDFGSAAAVATPVATAIDEVIAEPSEQVAEEIVESQEPAPLDRQDGAVPDWLRGTPAVAPIEEGAEESPLAEDDDTPDWLKNRAEDDDDEEEKTVSESADNEEEESRYDLVSEPTLPVINEEEQESASETALADAESAEPAEPAEEENKESLTEIAPYSEQSAEVVSEEASSDIKSAEPVAEVDPFGEQPVEAVPEAVSVERETPEVASPEEEQEPTEERVSHDEDAQKTQTEAESVYPAYQAGDVIPKIDDLPPVSAPGDEDEMVAEVVPQAEPAEEEKDKESVEEAVSRVILTEEAAPVEEKSAEPVAEVAPFGEQPVETATEAAPVEEKSAEPVVEVAPFGEQPVEAVPEAAPVEEKNQELIEEAIPQVALVEEVVPYDEQSAEVPFETKNAQPAEEAVSYHEEWQEVSSEAPTNSKNISEEGKIPPFEGDMLVKQEDNTKTSFVAPPSEEAWQEIPLHEEDDDNDDGNSDGGDSGGGDD